MKIKKLVKSAALLLVLGFSVSVASVFFRPDYRPSLSNALEWAGLRDSRYVRAQRQTVLIRTETGQGTGVIVKRVDPFGHARLFVWTAAHVVDDTDTPKVVLTIKNDFSRVGETVFTGQVILRDDRLDLALLWVDAPGDVGVGAELDSVVPLEPGSTVFHVGNFWGQALFNSVSTGVVSEVGVKPGEGFYWPVCDQTTLTIQPGSSGGPLFNSENGRVAGLVVGLRANVGFFVPVRAMAALATAKGLTWAAADGECPGRSRLEVLAVMAAVEHVKVPPALQVIIGLDIQ